MSELVQPLASPQCRRATQVSFKRLPARGNALSYGSLVAFLACIYLTPALLIPELDALRPAQLASIAALCGLFIERTTTRRGFDLVWPESYLMLALVAAAGLSSLTALWTAHALEATVDLLKYAAIYFLIVNAVEDVGNLRGLMWTMVLGGLVPAMGALKHRWDGTLIGGRTGWVGIFANPNDLAYSLVILIPLAASLSIGARGWVKAAVGGIILIYAAATYTTYSRGGMLALCATLALVGLRRSSISTRFLTLGLLAAAIVFSVYFWSRQEGFADLTADSTFRQRLGTVRAGLAMFLDRPLLGVGIGCSVIAWPLYAPSDVFSQGWLYTHNTFVQPLSEMGLFGFLPFALLLGAALIHARTLWRRGRPEVASLASGLEISLWAFLVCGLSGGYLLSWFPYLLIGLASAAWRIGQPAPASRGGR